MKGKCILSTFMAAVLVFMSGIGVYANATATTFVPAVSDPSSINVILNGTEIVFDTDPVLINNRTMVPLRAIMEALDYVIEWDSETRTVVATQPQMQVVLTIDSDVSYVNGTPYCLDAVPCIRDNRTLVPVRFISEIIGMDVQWNSYARTVFINNAESFETEYDEYGKVKYVGQKNILGDRCGFGRSYNEDGTVLYVGQWWYDEEYGIGSFTWKNGITFEGDCKFGEASGHGKMIFPGIGTYVGTFLNGQRSQNGVFTWQNGDIYDGAWSMDKMSGNGIYTFADGTVLSGHWYNNELMR